MSTTEMMERMAKASPRVIARFVVLYYLITILTGACILFFHSRLAFAVAVFYLAVTAVLYELSKRGKRI